MSEKEISAETKNAIFAVIMIVLLIGILIIFFPKTILPWIQGLGGEKLDPETKGEIIDNFDILVENLDICQAMKDESCFCETFPNFPAVFHTNAVLKVDNGASNLTLYDKKIELKSLEIEPTLKILSAKESPDGLFSHKVDLPAVFNLVFSEKVPKVKEVSRGYVISNYALKESSGIFILTFYNPNVPDKPNIIQKPFIGSKNVPPDASLEQIRKLIDKMPKCQEGRPDAIAFFNDLDSETGQKLVELPAGFIIHYNNQEAWLEYDSEKVNQMKTSNSGQDTLIIPQEVKKTIVLCQGSRPDGEITDNMVIDIKEENNKKCIFV